MKYIIFIVLLLLSNSIFSAPSCSKNGTTIIYTNGVTTSRENAGLAKEKIKFLNLNSQIDLKPEKVKYVLAYNYEESISRDFLEAAVQRFPVGFLRSLGVTNGYAAYMGYLNGGLADAVYAIALNSITDKLVEIQSDWVINYRSSSLYLKTIQEIRGHYEVALNNGERVFAVSHSQGGLFMSDAFDAASFSDKQKYFSGFQIASPLPDEMNSHFGYATHDKDRLINFVRGTVGALPSNVTAPLIVNNAYEGISDYAIDFVINHGIVTTYLNDSTIRSQVIPKLVATAQLLESNCSKVVINYTQNNLVVNFNSTNPQDPNESGLIYSWNFGDGTSVSTESKYVSHKYKSGGNYVVILTVKDSLGNDDQISKTIFVKEDVAVPSIIIDYTKNMKRIDLSIRPTPSSAVQFRIDYGDGATETIEMGISTYHEYANTGTFNITVSALDAHGVVLVVEEITVYLYMPNLNILESPTGTIRPGTELKFKIECDDHEQVFMGTQTAYDFISYDLKPSDLIISCTGLEQNGTSQLSDKSIHEITCQTRKFQEMEHYSFLVANGIAPKYQTNPDRCQYQYNSQYYITFFCGLKNNSTGESYYGGYKTAPIFTVFDTEETYCRN